MASEKQTKGKTAVKELARMSSRCCFDSVPFRDPIACTQQCTRTLAHNTRTSFISMRGPLHLDGQRLLRKMIAWALTVSFKFFPRCITWARHTTHVQVEQGAHVANLVRAVEAPIIGARLMFVSLPRRPSLYWRIVPGIEVCVRVRLLVHVVAA